MRFKTIIYTLLQLYWVFLSASAETQIRFDRARCQITGARVFQVQLLIGSAPTDGFSICGVAVNFSDGNANETGTTAFVFPAEWDFIVVRGAAAGSNAGPGLASAKGRRDFALASASTCGDFKTVPLAKLVAIRALKRS